jgi:predicted ester cyclase
MFDQDLLASLFQKGKERFSLDDLNALDTVFAPDYVCHHRLNPVQGPEGVKQWWNAFRTAFPDLEFSIGDVIMAGDKIVVRWAVSGTQQNSWMGVAPTRNYATLTGITIFRLADEKIVESWDEFDLFGLLYQLGAFNNSHHPGVNVN